MCGPVEQRKIALLRPSGCRRTRIIQTSFGFNGRFCPIRRPLFQGSRCREGMGFSVVMVGSGRAGPLHLSAGSTSTGSNNLPWERPNRAHSSRFLVPNR